MSQSPSTLKVFRAAMNLFLVDGQFHTTGEIAYYLGWPEVQVQLELALQITGVTVEIGQRTSEETKLTRSVAVYGPSRDALRAEILSDRTAAEQPAPTADTLSAANPKLLRRRGGARVSPVA